MAADRDHAREPSPAAQRERRWGLVWDGFFALTLAAPTVYALADAPSATHRAVTLGVAAAFGLWHWQAALRHLEWEGRAAMLVWFAGALAFTWVLLGRHDSYLFVIYGLYPQLFRLLSRYRYVVPGVIVLTVTIFWRTGVVSADSLSGDIVSVAGSVLLSLMVGLFVAALVRQSAARQRALDELEATRAELAAAARRAGVLEERERLAREIHDTVAQGFTGIVMQLEASEQALDADPGRAREHLDRARCSARESLAEVRRAVHALRPEVLDGATLAEALDRTARRWSQETGIPAATVTTGVTRPLPPDTEIALLRTAQEALANVAKHAHATQVTVRLDYAPAQAVLAVDDDGAGFEAADRRAAEGYGLAGITERMGALGGSLRVDSQRGRGTRLTAHVPAPTASTEVAPQ